MTLSYRLLKKGYPYTKTLPCIKNNMFGKIAAVGIEVEGPWTDNIPVGGFVQDFHDEYMPHPRTAVPVIFRECVSTPLKYPVHLKKFFEDISPHWYEPGVTEGMGMHVHFSFKEEKYYELLLNKSFVKEMYDKLFADFKTDERLQKRPAYVSPSGSNFYKTNYPDEYWLRSPARNPNEGRQADGRKNRYYMINFWRAYEAHKTFEVRIFPATSIERMHEYALWLIDFINEYCDRNECNANRSVKREVVARPEKKHIVLTKKNPWEGKTLNFKSYENPKWKQ